MKKKIYTFALACLMSVSFTNCNDFLDYNPTAVIDEDKAFSEPEKMVNAAYAMLGDCWFSYPFNLLTSSLRHPKRQDGQTMASMTDVRVSAS